MAETAGPKPEIINASANNAMAKAKANPSQLALFDVVRQLDQGDLTVVNTVTEAHTSAFDPTSLPGDLIPSQAVLAINSEKGPVLVAFTARNVGTMLPQGGPQHLEEHRVPANQVVAIASKEPYAGMVIDPGSENSILIPSIYLKAGLPAGGTNTAAKTLLNNPNLAKNPSEAAAREELVRAIAKGPVYTAIEKAAYEASKETKFPLIPLDPSAIPAGQAPPPGTAAAVVFGTSPAEISAAFPPELWIPIPVRMNDVVANVRQNANVKLVVINPAGPTLQLPITADPPVPTSDTGASASENPGLVDNHDLLSEPTPAEGPSTEPDAGTREGED